MRYPSMAVLAYRNLDRSTAQSACDILLKAGQFRRRKSVHRLSAASSKVVSSDVIAIGDAENDVEMLQLAGLGVAMANASKRVKAAADLAISSNSEAGLARFLKACLEE